MKENHLLNESIGKLFIKYGSLNIMSMVGLSLYILADTFFVSKALGSTGLASLNFAIPVATFLNGAGLMLGMGGASLYSLNKAGNNPEKSYQLFSICVLTSIASGILTVLIFNLFSDKVVTFLGASGNSFQNTKIYLNTYIAFAPAFLLNNVLVCFIRNDNNPKLAMTAMLAGSIGNIILDYIFMFKFGWGMFGAALATGLSPVMGILISSFHFLKGYSNIKFSLKKLNIKRLAGIAAAGLQAFITESSSSVLMLSFNILILKTAGETAVAAYGIIANLALVANAVFTGTAQGCQPIISTNCGAGIQSRTDKAAKLSVSTAAMAGVLIYGFSLVYCDNIIAVFNSENNIQLADMAKTGMLIYFAAFPLSGVNISLSSYFSAVNNPGPAFAVSSLRGFALLLPVLLFLSNILGLSGIWLSVPLTELITCVVALCFIVKQRQGTSKKPSII